jgi:hypothetical protein
MIFIKYKLITFDSKNNRENGFYEQQSFAQTKEMKMNRMVKLICVITALGLVLSGCTKKKEPKAAQPTEQADQQVQQEPVIEIQIADNNTSQVEPSLQPEQALWNTADKEGAIEAYQRFIEKYPNSTYTQQAKAAIDKLFSPADDLMAARKRKKYNFEGFGSPMIATITTKEQGKHDISCPLASQEEAISIAAKPGVVSPNIAEPIHHAISTGVSPVTTPEIVTVHSYLGYPFTVETLRVDNNKIFYYKNTIKIEDVQSGIIIPSSDSPVPMEVNTSSGDLKIIPWAQAINMVWEFTKPGISIDAENRTLISEENGAQIAFTRYGIEPNRVKVIEK